MTGTSAASARITIHARGGWLTLPLSATTRQQLGDVRPGDRVTIRVTGRLQYDGGAGYAIGGWLTDAGSVTLDAWGPGRSALWSNVVRGCVDMRRAEQRVSA